MREPIFVVEFGFHVPGNQISGHPPRDIDILYSGMTKKEAIDIVKMDQNKNFQNFGVVCFPKSFMVISISVAIEHSGCILFFKIKTTTPVAELEQE